MARPHAQIVSDAGDEKLIDLLAVKPHQPRDWRIRDSIPPEYWRAIAGADLTTLEELAEAIETKRTAAA